MSDPWEGIPQELREKIDACFDVGSFLGTWQQRQEATADLTAAIRSLVSRLREAEQDAALGKLIRPNCSIESWKEKQQWRLVVLGLSQHQVIGPIPATVDEAVARLSSGETPTP